MKYLVAHNQIGSIGGPKVLDVEATQAHHALFKVWSEFTGKLRLQQQVFMQADAPATRYTDAGFPLGIGSNYLVCEHWQVSITLGESGEYTQAAIIHSQMRRN